MTPEEKKTFEEGLYAWVGQEVAPPTPALDSVNEAMIRHWCEVMGDNNPVYTDREFAEKSSKGGLIAPPTMLQAWSLEGYPMAFADQLTEDQMDGQRKLHAYLEKHGYTGVLGTNCDQEYFRDLRPGDTVVAHTIIDSISEEKATAMGVGYFITTVTTFTDQNGEKVGTMEFRVVKFTPAQKPEPVTESEEHKAPTRIRSVRGHDNSWWWNEVEQNGVVPIQRCKSCQTLRHPPRPFCNQCQSNEWDFITSNLEGEIFSFIELHYPEIPGYEYPLICAVISLDEGTRIVSNIIDCSPSDVAIGKRVKGEVMEVDADNTIPQFRLA
jgi:uncharacterized OB-fold protein/acyl dehydratase